MKIVQEFKTFALKGNVIDMAVGIIIGAAFGKIVAALVSDVLMPPLGFLIGGVNFTDLKVVIKEAVGDNPAVTLNYGNFLQVTFDFMIVAFAIFLLIKVINTAKERSEKAAAAAAVPTTPPPPPAPSKEELLLAEIRDLLKQKV